MKTTLKHFKVDTNKHATSLHKEPMKKKATLMPFRDHSGKFGPIWPTLSKIWNHFGVNFSPFFSPKWPDCAQIMYSGTDYNYTVLVGAIFGPFRANLTSFIRQEPDIEAIFKDNFTPFSVQNDLNTPKLLTVAGDINAQNSGGLLFWTKVCLLRNESLSIILSTINVAPNGEE